ncbi:MAG: magnesium transporter [Micrococcales bacterium]|nr:magnesium transporter [Micrococcales bacterium]
MTESLTSDLALDDLPQLKADLAELRPKEIARLMGRLGPRDHGVVFRLLDKDVALRVFESMDARLARDLVNTLQHGEVTEVLEGVSPDDRVALLDELPAGIVATVLRGLSPRERAYTALLMGYPDGSIGRRMTPEYVAVRDTYTCRDVLKRVRERGEEAITIDVLPVLGTERNLVGILTLRAALLAEPDQLVSDLVERIEGISALADEEESARRMLALDLAAAPIVDSEGRLVGVLPWDDAVDILREMEEEDAARTGGTEPLRQPYLSVPVLRLVRSRIVWLLVLAVSAALTVSVLDRFEDELAAVVTLALFIPLLTGTAGNTGAQAATTVTRALATGDVRTKDLLAVAGRELRTGSLMGLVLGAIAFAPVMVFAGSELATVVSLTLVLVCPLSATVGGMMPLAARAMGVDPAVFSTPFISTFCDATGLLIYFFIAIAVLGI